MNMATDAGWQRALLPFMTRAIVLAGLAFFVSSSVHVLMMHSDLRMKPSEVRLELPQGRSRPGEPMPEAWAGLLALEHQALLHRQQTINAVVLRQTSLLHLGFLTGTVLCLVGAVFVLGRLQMPDSSFEGEAPKLKFSLRTASPGIVLALLGSGLMCATLYHRFQFNLPQHTSYVLPASYACPSNAPAATPSDDGVGTAADEKR
ncbi:hypothetical protein QLQ15_13435 [Lysobacter sp. LF1]|uniref:DUF202 domain-containing protein n=1 Tax=Lysobacter stagni TaxID=3045172 RepID=A0ABT6XID2_9GAMM|nr:hypothetical protein [Lysobacter sp. LF1]MDI9239909.1 hypothetical protein [Lysobacter sp. LF1]